MMFGGIFDFNTGYDVIDTWLNDKLDIKVFLNIALRPLISTRKN